MHCDSTLKNRVKRAQGQMAGVLNMMESGATCENIVVQLKAVRSSIDKALGLLTAHHLLQTIESRQNLEDDAVKAAVELIVKAM
ncbi:MAG: metal-sensitive transcriptional regulator [Acholeplasmatales bacterium]|nr:MAG: metal-sensitive transcriptional regulator [Acholeplasmatales bacterium]